MTDEEWALLEPFVTYRRGRPPLDPRRTWDGIFWVACSVQPWATMPPEFGRPDTAHSTLIYAARKDVLRHLLLLVSRHPFAREDMECLEWRIARAYRRASRQLGAAGVIAARDLGMASALPCEPEEIPPPVTTFSMPQPDRAPRLPRIPRRVLRGLPAHPQTPPHLAPLPPRRPGQPRRDEQAHSRPVRKAIRR